MRGQSVKTIKILSFPSFKRHLTKGKHACKMQRDSNLYTVCKLFSIYERTNEYVFRVDEDNSSRFSSNLYSPSLRIRIRIRINLFSITTNNITMQYWYVSWWILVCVMKD